MKKKGKFFGVEISQKRLENGTIEASDTPDSNGRATAY